MRKFLFLAIFLTVPAALLLAITDTPTETVTATVTETVTETVTQTNTPDWTATETPTITMTHTITATPTMTPTPQQKVLAYPNPAYSNTMGIAYPLDSAKTARLVEIKIYNAAGEKSMTVIDDDPHGYTKFDIAKLSRGIYFYRLKVIYADGTEVKPDPEKFSVIR